MIFSRVGENYASPCDKTHSIYVVKTYVLHARVVHVGPYMYYVNFCIVPLLATRVGNVTSFLIG